MYPLNILEPLSARAIYVWRVTQDMVSLLGWSVGYFVMSLFVFSFSRSFLVHFLDSYTTVYVLIVVLIDFDEIDVRIAFRGPK